MGHWAKKSALHLKHHQDLVHNVARVDAGGVTAPLCLCKGGQSPIPTLNSGLFLDLLGLAAED
jgi:hypothetical protein